MILMFEGRGRQEWSRTATYCINWNVVFFVVRVKIRAQNQNWWKKFRRLGRQRKRVWILKWKTASTVLESVWLVLLQLLSVLKMGIELEVINRAIEWL